MITYPVKSYKIKDMVPLHTYAELRAYCDKLAAGLPEGMLPRDVENIREANAQFAMTNQELMRKIDELNVIVAALEKQLEATKRTIGK